MFQIEVVEQCKANNRKAQLALYKQYCDGMFCVAMRFLKNADDAEDDLMATLSNRTNGKKFSGSEEDIEDIYFLISSEF